MRLNVTQGDSLLTTEIQEGLYKDFVQLISPNKKEFSLPKEAIRNPEFQNFLPRLVEAACDHSPLPDEVPEELKEPLESFLSSLTKIIDEEGDSVWTWYILNTIGPFSLFERKVNRILANPPWVRASDIQVKNRKAEVESMAKKLELWVGGKHATGFDIAALFVHRCRNLYLDGQNSKAAWITNNSAIKGGNWEAFRNRHGKFLTRIIDYGELKEQPFSGAKSCALIEDSPVGRKTEMSRLVNGQEKISRNQKWSEIRNVTYLDVAPEPIPKAESKYVGKFRNGATIFPHCLLVIEKAVSGKNDRITIKTKKSQHSPWKNMEPPKETIPKRWVAPCIFSDDLLPFMIREENTQTVIPLGEDGLLEQHPEKETYWLKADKLYQRNKGKGKTTPQTLLNQIDFSSKLSKQLPVTGEKSDFCQVVYNKSGQHLRAARCSESMFIVENSCYWWRTGSEEEAQYLVSFLNAQCLQDAYRECRKSDRDFNTHIWNGVPIPQYDPKNNQHRELANLCVQAENFVSGMHEKLNFNYKQGKLSGDIKRALQESGISKRIDETIKRILPNQIR